MKKLIIHIHHASVNIPFKKGFVADDTIINKEILKLTDWYTDELFLSEKDIMVKAGFSRIFCDVERFEDDQKEVMAAFGMGVLYTKNDQGLLIREVTSELRQTILKNYYRKHHKKLAYAVSEELNENGTALIIDGHSFPDIPFKRDLEQIPDRPDFNIGTDPYHTPRDLVEFSVEFFRKRGYVVAVDRPYSGTN